MPSRRPVSPPHSVPGERQLSPRGEEFEVAGHAREVEYMRAPAIPAEARAELLVIKGTGAFLCARPDGDIRAPAPGGEGLYARDTRILSELVVGFGEIEPVLLSHSVESGFRAIVNQTNPALEDADGVEIPQETLNLRRTLVLDSRLFVLIELRSFFAARVRVPLALTLAADFADVFEVRGVRRRASRGQEMVPKLDGCRLAFAYRGQDGAFQETVVELDPRPDQARVEGGRARLSWTLAVARGEIGTVLVSPTPAGGRRRPTLRSFKRTAAALERSRSRWAAACTQIRTDNELLAGVLEASERDLHALLTPVAKGRIPAAGIPWYVAPFGRDSLLCAQQSLLLSPEIARETLIALAALQAEHDDPWRDAEPGKILHELRRGELARAGLIPHTPYYGTVDATPLFLILAGSYQRWSGDLETLSALRGALERALDWIDHHGDLDGDGFVEYRRRSPAGLENQGWKDSQDAIVHADGSPAQPPIALVEVQGYVHLAKLAAADVFEALGESDRARGLRAQAARLRKQFNDAYWMAQEGTFALALDGRGRQVQSVTSNPGHCLYCGIVEERKAAALAERLMAPDMFSGWGVRTLSADSPAYNPMSYHNGSIWPHDNAIIAAGLKRYGHDRSAEQIATAIFDIAARARDHRLAELYCGFRRRPRSEVVPYPVACMPQAWAASAPFLLLQALLGLEPGAPERTLAVVRPRLPEWLGRVDLRDLRIGDARVSLAFTQNNGITSFSLLGQRGELTVTMAAAPHGR
jgi:glycogen debranching enzyme